MSVKRVFLATLMALMGVGASSASAAIPSPGWTIDSFATPTNFSASRNAECESAISGGRGECDTYRIAATNAGAAPTDGSSAVLTDALPAGLTVQRVQFFVSAIPNVGADLSSLLCSTVPLRCEYPGPYGAFLPPLPPDGTLKMVVATTVDPGTTGELANSATVSGGGAPTVSTRRINPLDGATPAFGIQSFDFHIAGLDGMPDTQAGDHPYEVTTTIELNNTIREAPNSDVLDTSIEDVKDFVADLPLGFVGSTLAAPQCPMVQLSSGSGCPASTVIGHIVTEPHDQEEIDSPIYNLVPERGRPGEFGYYDGLKGTHVFYARVVPTPAGYVLRTINPDTPQVGLNRVVVTFYGDPTARDASGNADVPFFTNAADCAAGPMTATLHIDSWQHPGRVSADGNPDFSDPNWVSAQSVSPPLAGCNRLRFTPEVKAQPTTHESDRPSGMEFEIKIPQSETVGVPAAPTLKKAVVTLPEGFTVDPSAGDGLAACSESQIGWEAGAPGPLKFNAAPPACPEASKIGSLELETPLIPRALTGELFLASQDANPFNTTLAAYVIVNDPITGVLIKIAGEFLSDPVTGRLTAVFDENPDLPFSDLKLHFFGGPRAELATPESCGTFTTNTELSPYSLEEGELPATPFDSFVINEACPSGFSPSFTAGSTNLQAGAYTPFVASFQRSDTDQELSGLTVKLPPGLSAIVAGVPECTEAQIKEVEAGTGGCPESTQVGTVRAGVGPGPDPFFATGKAYWTGPYNGGPFGLAVVVPAIAGPFNFGAVVVRQSIRIDPTTAQVTDVSDPFPTIIDGIPLRMRRVDVELNRPGFTFNPTDCEKLGFAGTITGSPLGAPRSVNAHTVGYATQAGATSSFTTPFQVTNCATLGFKPGFKVSTAGKTSRANGASLRVKLTYPKAPFGSQANIRSVHVELPKALPSRLSTLNHACLDSVFNQDPASCPSQSKVGFATAVTPVLPVPLEGPAYFVSHGGQKFPELVVVLQGDGVTVYLNGETSINEHTNVTSSTFKTVPDVPVGSFELNLPQGPFSALAANTDLCTASLTMPTVFDAQNGAQLKQDTPIEVEDCPYSLRIVRRSVHKQTLTLRVSVPAAGKLAASGNGVSAASKSAKGRQTLVLTLKERRAGKLRSTITLRFTPRGTTGKQRGKTKILRKSLVVAFR